jgi:hypothetical protein
MSGQPCLRAMASNGPAVAGLLRSNYATPAPSRKMGVWGLRPQPPEANTQGMTSPRLRFTSAS